MNSKSCYISLVLILVLFGILGSCHKNQEFIKIGGTVVSLNENSMVAGVKVELYTRKIESGIYSANYNLFEIIESDENGKFEFLLPNITWASVKVFFSKEGYYNLEHEIQGDVLRSSGGFNEDFNLDPKAWLKFKIQNIDTSSENDMLDYRILNGTRSCDACCTSSRKLFEGENVNVETICRIIGHQNILIQWNTTVNGVIVGKQEMYFVPAFDTTLIEYYY